MLQDIAYAVRGLRKTPVFTAVAIVSLTLAIGANTAILSLLNALALRDLAVRDPQQLVQVSSIPPNAIYELGLTFPMYREFLRRQQVLSAAVAWTGNRVLNVEADREQTRGAIVCVSGNFYAELGIAALRGRLLNADDVNETTIAPVRVAVIGYTFWQRHYGGDDSVIGRIVRIEEEPFTIVGVAPKGFTGVGLTIEPDVTIPLTAFPIMTHNPPRSLMTSASLWVRVTGRLKPGTSLAQARASIEAMWPGLAADTVPPAYAGSQRDRFLGTRVAVASAATGYEPGLRARFTRPLVIVLGIAALVLLIACVNLASLMLARAAARLHDVGVRLALGASRWRIARQVIVEGVLLASIGAACGTAFAYASSHALMRQILADYLVPIAIDVSPDGRLLVLTAAVALGAGILFSAVPAWRAARQDSSALLRHGARTVSGTGRMGRLLVGAQIALSLVLLTNAGLLVRTLQQIRAIDSGMRSDDVMVAYPGPRPGGYRGVDNDSYYPRVLERIAAMPGISRAAISLLKPAGGGNGGGERVSRIASASDGAAGGGSSLFGSVSPGFFETIGVALRSGRDFSWADNSRGRRVAIVSETLARQMFPAGDGIGQHVRIGVLPRRQDVEVIGIVADAHMYDLKDPNLAAVYVPALQEPESVNFKCFVIRGQRVSLSALNGVLDAFGYERAGEAQTLAYITDRALLQERITAAIAAFFGGLALLLGAIGLYGMMSYDVTRRHREIGIRMALGANPAGVVRAILRDGCAVTLAGVAAGLAGALVSSRLVQSLLFGVTAYDPLTFLAAAAVLVTVAIAACLLPARRASRVDPLIALRAE
jgi:predicted permease